MLMASGSYGASSGAARPTTITTSTMAAPSNVSGRRTSQRRIRRPRPPGTRRARAGPVSVAASVIADPRVDDTVEQVDDEVDAAVDQGADERDAHDGRGVEIRHRAHGVVRHTRPGEDGFRHHSTLQQGPVG